MQMQKLIQAHHNLGQEWFVRVCGVYLSVLVLFWIVPVWAQQPSSAGQIDQFNGDPSSDFLWTRNSSPLTVGRYKSLQKGDNITVKGQKASITLSLANNKGPVTLKHQDTKEKPYEVKNNDVACGMWCNMMDVTGVWLTCLFNSNCAKGVPAWPTRGPNNGVKVTFPLTELDNATLLADKNELYVFWTGGNPRYQVKVVRVEKGQPGPEWASKEENNSKVEAIKLTSKSALTKGEYQIVINNSIEGYFTVVDNSPNSKELEDIKKSQLPPNTQAVLRATSFAKQGKKWQFEAYQHVARMADANARRIKAELEKEKPTLPE